MQNCLNYLKLAQIICKTTQITCKSAQIITKTAQIIEVPKHSKPAQLTYKTAQMSFFFSWQSFFCSCYFCWYSVILFTFLIIFLPLPIPFPLPSIQSISSRVFGLEFTNFTGFFLTFPWIFAVLSLPYLSVHLHYSWVQIIPPGAWVLTGSHDKLLQ